MPSQSHDRTFAGDFRKFFVRKLAVLLPSVLTLWILFYAYRFVNANVAEPINAGIRQAVIALAPATLGEKRLPAWFNVTAEQLGQAQAERSRQSQRPLPDAALRANVRAANFQDWWNDHWYLRVIGLIVAMVLIYLTGVTLGGYLGRSLYRRLDQILQRMPIVRLVYPYVKQVVEFLFGQNQKVAFKRVVLVEYPRMGVWSIGLVTGAPIRAIEAVARGGCITVFVPSSPTPFTGYTITVRNEDAIDMPITIDEAIRFVVTGGVLTPDRLTRPQPEPSGALPGSSPGAGGSSGESPPGGRDML